MRVGIVAGEASGDLLGAELVAELRRLHPDISFEGIAGPQMQLQGVRPLYPMERLSVMGLVEILSRYRELVKARKKLIQYFLDDPPDLFIGIDAPEFNLDLEQQLKEAGIRTVHYVSPSVWAWRKYRVKKIAKAVDLMLCLFPFETQFYQSHNVPALFVGHPLADIIPDETDKVAARKELKLKTEGEIVAILPGSRSNELHYLSEVFIQTAMWCVERRPGLLFVVPLANEHRRKQFEEALSRQDYLPPIRLIDGQSRLAMAAADVVLLASGTATLEALLLKRPMVVSYRVANLTYIIFKTLSTVKYYSLPNLLSGIELVPELLQTRATPENLGVEILAYLEHPDMAANLTQHFSHIHHQLRRNASLQAAQAILNMR